MIYEVIEDWKEATDSPDGEIIIEDLIVAPELPEEFSTETWDSYSNFILNVDSTSPGAWDIRNNEQASYVGWTEYLPNKRMIILTDLVEEKATTDEGILDKKKFRSFFKKVIRHEMGHILNLSHEDGSTIMAGVADWETPDCIDQNTLNEFCDVNLCGANAHATCD